MKYFELFNSNKFNGKYTADLSGNYKNKNFLDFIFWKIIILEDNHFAGRPDLPPSVELDLTGIGVRWFACKEPDSGIAAVYYSLVREKIDKRMKKIDFRSN